MKEPTGVITAWKAALKFDPQMAFKYKNRNNSPNLLTIYNRYTPKDIASEKLPGPKRKESSSKASFFSGFCC